MAVADSDADVQLRVSDESSEGCTIMKDGTVDNYANTITVKAITLDQLVQNHKLMTVDILKVDAEGAEVAILNGGLKLAIPMTQKVLIETHSSDLKSSCIKLLADFGFQPVLDVPSGRNELGDNSVVYLLRLED